MAFQFLAMDAAVLNSEINMRESAAELAALRQVDSPFDLEHSTFIQLYRLTPKKVYTLVDSIESCLERKTISALSAEIQAEEVYTKYKQSSPDAFKILGVTCVHGNTDVDNATMNALRVLDSVDRLDIPVFKGCAKPMISHIWKRRKHFHGKDGFGDIQHERKIDVGLIQKQHAVNAMYEFACQYPKMVDYILVGPLTNFAMCINMYGDDFLNKIHDVYIMGGNVRGKGNATKCAEFNFMIDPEAANIVLENIKTPLTILPWETCIDGDLGITFAWRMEVLGKVPSKAIELLNRVEDAIFTPKGFVNWIVCDAMLVACYILPQHAIAKSRKYHATVELTGMHTRGQMVLDHLRDKEDNATIIMEVHREHYKEIISWTAGVEGVCLDEQF